MEPNDYHLEKVSNTIIDLITVLQYDRAKKFKLFTWIERMQICHFRSALQSFINYLFRDIKHSQINWYQVPETLQKKIDKYLENIARENWQHKPDTD